jgi:Predicted nucleotide-binding protein containing TIR-like domain
MSETLTMGRSVAMGETFGHRLKQFALAVDIVDEDTFKHVWELVRRYVSLELELAYWALLIEGEVNKNPGRQARECSNENKPSFSLKTAEGCYNGLAAYSFAEAKPLWIVSPDKQHLSPDTLLRDDWSGTKTLPHCDQSVDGSIRTMILLPLRWKGRTFGVLDLQSTQYDELTNIATVALELLADTLSELLVLSDTNQTQRAHTLQAIGMLRTILQEESWPPLTKPQIFVASSDRADEAVMGTIRSVLNDFKDRLRSHYWKESSNSGNINWDILKQVKASRFGLCYFSEPAEDAKSEFRYQDNANVVFEAGMFQSLTNPAATDQPTGWIPVRDPQLLSPHPPFDFAQQRMIIVERLTDNQPHLDRLRADLKARIENLLSAANSGGIGNFMDKRTA